MPQTVHLWMLIFLIFNLILCEKFDIYDNMKLLPSFFLCCWLYICILLFYQVYYMQNMFSDWIWLLYISKWLSVVLLNTFKLFQPWVPVNQLHCSFIRTRGPCRLLRFVILYCCFLSHATCAASSSIQPYNSILSLDHLFAGLLWGSLDWRGGITASTVVRFLSTPDRSANPAQHHRRPIISCDCRTCIGTVFLPASQH